MNYTVVMIPSAMQTRVLVSIADLGVHWSTAIFLRTAEVVNTLVTHAYAASIRRCISVGVTSSLRVARNHLWPNGSASMATRSP
jgi:hypothetical protein